MNYCSAIWAAVVAVLMYIILERSGFAAELTYVDIEDIQLPSAMEGPYALNTRLRDNVEALARGQLDASESIAIDSTGNIFGATRHGEVFQLVKDDNGEFTVQPWARLGGVPLGMQWGPDDGLLWIADAAQGLLSVDPITRQATLRSTHVTNSSGFTSPILFADDVAIASDGSIFFTDACAIPPGRNVKGEFDVDTAVLSFMSGKRTGRVLRYNPVTRETSIVLKGLAFANGLALSSDESFLAIAETMTFRIIRYWLTGPKAGTHDVLIDHLPGCPDGVDAAVGGGFWVTIPTPAPAAAPFLMRHRPLRAFVARLGKAAQLDMLPWASVLKISETGEVLECLHDPQGQKVKAVTSATEYEGGLYLGTLKSPFIPVVPLPLS